jgi:REP element-mobilizing transposase RayT
MARRPRVFAAGLLYHVIVRGNQRRKTFRHDDDYRAYLDRLDKYRAQCRVRIYAFLNNGLKRLLKSSQSLLVGRRAA